MICGTHQAEYGEYCPGCLLDERDRLIERLQAAGCPETRPELRRLSMQALRSMTAQWEHRKRRAR